MPVKKTVIEEHQITIRKITETGASVKYHWSLVDDKGELISSGPYDTLADGFQRLTTYLTAGHE